MIKPLKNHINKVKALAPTKLVRDIKSRYFDFGKKSVSGKVKPHTELTTKADDLAFFKLNLKF